MTAKTPQTSPTTPGLSGTSAVIVEAPRARVSVEIETMSKGPAKVTVRVDGEDSVATAREALDTYHSMVMELESIEGEKT